MGGSFFNHRRNVLLSCIYYLETEVDLTWTGSSAVNVLKSYADIVQADIPAIAIDMALVEHEEDSLGCNELDHIYSIAINFFAKSDSFNMDLVDFVIDKLRLGFVYYKHSLSNNEYVRVANGRVTMDAVQSDEKVPYEETIHEKEKYRHELIITFKRNLLS